uniref:Uncharacterized protein n=1 Tax=Anguilla anguilla TaxID=7936 RepID=A0A0E9X0W0_ANGAN
MHLQPNAYTFSSICHSGMLTFNSEANPCLFICNYHIFYSKIM